MDKTTQKVYKKLGLIEKNIGSYKFQITLLPCGPAGRVFWQAMDIIGPGVGVAIDKYRNFDYVSPDQDTTWAEILGMFTSKLRSGDLDFVIDSILSDCIINGERFDPESHLRGEFSVYMELVKWALEENYEEFFMQALKGFGMETDTLKKLMDTMKKQGNPSATDSPDLQEGT